MTHPYTLLVRHLDDAAFLGHRDRARGLTRSLRRTGLPLELTRGFHPRPRMSLPEPLPVGVGSMGERYVVYLLEEIAPEQVRESFRDKLPQDMELVEVCRGALREPVDVPIVILADSVDPDRVFGFLQSLDLEELRLAELELAGAGEAVRAKLIPHAGQRASAGRLLRSITVDPDLSAQVHRLTRIEVAPLQS
jgi:hypothetical protein